MSQDFDAIIGPRAKFSEHKKGDQIRFRQGGQEKTGTIIHVRAPGPAIVGGKEHPLLYAVDTGEGFPVFVSPNDVVEEA